MDIVCNHITENDYDFIWKTVIYYKSQPIQRHFFEVFRIGQAAKRLFFYHFLKKRGNKTISIRKKGNKIDKTCVDIDEMVRKWNVVFVTRWCDMSMVTMTDRSMRSKEISKFNWTLSSKNHITFCGEYINFLLNNYRIKCNSKKDRIGRSIKDLWDRITFFLK